MLRRQEVAALCLLAGCGGSPAAPATVEIAGPAQATLLSASPPSSSARAPSRPPAGPIAWEASEPEARARARSGARPMIVWARADWAAPVLQMERTTWRDPRVEAAARGFVALRLDLTEAEGEAELYAKRYGVDTMPMIIVLDPRGQQVAVLRGMSDPGAIVAALEKAAQ
jgi:thiol:disulfide interchange protein